VALSITLALLGLSGGVDLWHASVEIDEALAVLNLLAGANAAALFTHAQALANRLAMAEIVLLVATTAAALNWVRIAYKNLRRLRVSGLSEPSALGWAGWFLPPGVFYVPPSRIQEIWRASDPAALPDPEAWKSSQGPWLIWLWWAFFLLRHIRINLNFAPLPVNDPAALKILLAAAWISAAACFLGVAAAALFSVIVVQIERRQWRRFDRLQD
jgi:hypothetical protein